MAKPSVTYLFDPLCGWCYGAGPTVARLAGSEVDLDVLPTGLFSGRGARPFDRSFSSYVWSADQRIAQMSGQVFSEAYRDKVLGVSDGWLNSEAATLGVVAAGLNDPTQRLDALKALQEGRYVHGRDNVTAKGVASILEDAGYMEAAALVRAPTQDVLKARDEIVGRGAALFQRLHANGVPALAVTADGTSRLLSANALFGGFEALLGAIETAA
jgi:putative protein-disulfide isomerase